MVDQAEKIDKLDAVIEKAIKTKKKIPLWQFFASLGIEGAGKTAGRTLMDHFGDFDKIILASVDELSGVEGIGEKTAQVIHEFFKSNLVLVSRLLLHIVLELPKVGKFSAYTFCLTGSFPEGKSKWEKEIQDRGGKVASSVSKKVNYVVVGTDAGSKEKKADELEIKKLTLDDLKKML